jgi:hypothetical protein
MKYPLPVIAIAAAALMAGCATDTPRLDAALGKSVAGMIEAQTYDPATAANPPALAPNVGDGQRLKNAIDANRKDVGKGAPEVARHVVFQVGGQGGQ